MHKLKLILKTTKSPWPDFMRTVQSLRIFTLMINYADGEWKGRHTHTERESERRRRERKGKTILYPLQQTNLNPLHMIQKYFIV